MRIGSRTGGVMVCTLSLQAEGPWFKSWHVVHIELEEGRLDIWWCILILNKGLITHLVVHMELDWGEVSILTLIGLFVFLTFEPLMLASCQE